MRLKKIDLGGLLIKNNVFLAPLAGYTNAVFRDICFGLGAGLTFTEMVSAKGLIRDSEKTRSLLSVSEGYGGVKACQIFGSDPDVMRRACESADLAPFELIDINMGCPVPKIYKNGEGCALMNDIPLAEKIISECKKSGKKISVKFRTGVSRKKIIAAEFAKACEGAGADMICLHGRTREDMYSGEVDYASVAAAKNSVKIPVIANGGVFCAADASKLMEETGADGIAVARGATYAPWIFCEIVGTPVPDKKELALRQLRATREAYGERFACVYMRKMLGFYLRGSRNASALKVRLLSAASCAEIESIIPSLPL